MYGINPHPNEVTHEVHKDYLFLWQLQNRHGVPCFAHDTYGWEELTCDVSQWVKRHVFLERAIYVRAYTHGKYPEIYKAMEDAGATIISMQEAERLVVAANTIPDVAGADG